MKIKGTMINKKNIFITIIIFLNIFIIVKYKLLKLENDYLLNNYISDSLYFNNLSKIGINSNFSNIKSEDKFVICLFANGCSPCQTEELLRVKNSFNGKLDNILIISNIEKKYLDLVLLSVELQQCRINTGIDFFIRSAMANDGEDPGTGSSLKDHLTDPDPCTYTCRKINAWGFEVTEDVPGSLIECHPSTGYTCTPKICFPLEPCWS